MDRTTSNGYPPMLASSLWILSQNGLRLGHAYTVLRTATIGRGIANRLIRLRGPLPARDGWRGDWADDSPRWTPEAVSSLQAAAAAAASVQHAGLDTSLREGGVHQQGGQAFWVSIGEAVSSFVEAGVCFAPSPSLAVSAIARGVRSHRRAQKNGGSGLWVQEARRRVILRRKRDGRVALKNGDTATGRSRGKHGNEEGEEGWAASQVYALSVYETSSMFFSLHQVSAIFVVSRILDTSKFSVEMPSCYRWIFRSFF